MVRDGSLMITNHPYYCLQILTAFGPHCLGLTFTGKPELLIGLIQRPSFSAPSFKAACDVGSSITANHP